MKASIRGPGRLATANSNEKERQAACRKNLQCLFSVGGGECMCKDEMGDRGFRKGMCAFHLKHGKLGIEPRVLD